MKFIMFIGLFSVLSSQLFCQTDTLDIRGEYQIKPGFNLMVLQEDDGLYIKPTGKSKEKLIHLSDDLYKIGSINGTIDFSLITKMGQPYLVIKMYGQTIHAPEISVPDPLHEYEEINLPDSLLTGLEGKYRLDSSRIFVITKEGKKLFALISGQQRFEIFPYAENNFFYKVVAASIEFVKNEENIAEYLLLRQGGIILRAERIINNN